MRSRALAVSEHGTVEVDRHELGGRAGHQARVLLTLLARDADGAAAVAQAHVWYGRAERERQAYAVRAARLCARARVEFLARAAREARRALALELRGAQLDALGAVQARIRLAQRGHLARQIAQLQVRVEHGVVGAVHERDLAEAAAHDELGLVDRMRQQLAVLATSADVSDATTHLLLLLRRNKHLLLLHRLLGRHGSHLSDHSAHVSAHGLLELRELILLLFICLLLRLRGNLLYIREYNIGTCCC